MFLKIYFMLTPCYSCRSDLSSIAITVVIKTMVNYKAMVSNIAITYLLYIVLKRPCILTSK